MKQQLSKINQKAFSLIELSIVILIISIFMASFLNMVGSINKRDKYAETREKMEKIAEALRAGYRAGKLVLPQYYANINNPVPMQSSSLALSFPSQVYIVSNSLAGPDTLRYGTGTYDDQIDPASLGGVPFLDLGLPEDYAYDAWGNEIIYFVAFPYNLLRPLGAYPYLEYTKFYDASVTNSGNNSLSRKPTKEEVLQGVADNCYGPGGANEQTVSGFDSVVSDCPVFILLSNGPNNSCKNGNTSLEPCQVANIQNNIALIINEGPTNTNRNSGVYFDDIVVYKTEKWLNEGLQFTYDVSFNGSLNNIKKGDYIQNFSNSYKRVYQVLDYDSANQRVTIGPPKFSGYPNPGNDLDGFNDGVANTLSINTSTLYSVTYNGN